MIVWFGLPYHSLGGFFFYNILVLPVVLQAPKEGIFEYNDPFFAGLLVKAWVGSSFLHHVRCNLEQPQYHDLEKMDTVDKITPVYGDCIPLLS
jgi:hypothetical protein